MRFLALIVLLSSLSLSSCKKEGLGVKVKLASGATIRLMPSETLRLSIGSEPPVMDWNRSTDMTSSTVNFNLMQGLVDYDISTPENKLIPALAKKWGSGPLAKVWTFYLRKDVKWSDGVPFTGQHIVDSWKRLLTAKTAAINAYKMFGIAGAREYNQGKVSFDKVGIKLLGPYTLQVELKESMSFFPMILTGVHSFPVRMDLINKFGSRWVEAKNSVTLGAYKMIMWEHDSQMILERNEYYYGEKPNIKYIHFYWMSRISTATLLFRRGKLDMVQDVPDIEVPQFKKTKEYVSIPSTSLYYFGFNTKLKPVDDVNLRKALVHAVDRNEVIKVLTDDKVPLSSFIPLGVSSHEPSIGLGFNVKKAKQYLAKSRYGNNPEKISLVIGFNATDTHKRVSENIQAQWKRNLGIKVELRSEEWKVYLNSLNVGKTYPVYRLGWVSDYPDADNFMQIHTSASENNRSRWKNKKYDNFVRLGAQELDQTKRKEYYDLAQKIFIEEHAVVMPILSNVNSFILNKKVKDFPTNSLERFYLRFARLAP